MSACLEWDCVLIVASTTGGLGVGAVVSFLHILCGISYIEI
jgi:hypothetical protein